MDRRTQGSSDCVAVKLVSYSRFPCGQGLLLLTFGLTVKELAIRIGLAGMTTISSSQVCWTSNSCIPHLSFNNCCELGVPCDWSQLPAAVILRMFQYCYPSWNSTPSMPFPRPCVGIAHLHVFQRRQCIGAHQLQRHRSWVLFLPDALSGYDDR